VSAAARRAGILWPALAAVPILAVLLGLGTWQLVRKAEKEALIAQVEARAGGPALPLPAREAWAGLDLGALDYQRVRLTGTFRQGREITLYGILPETRGRAAQPGFFVHVPFDLTTGGTVLVDRGFVPYARHLFAARPDTAPPEGQVTIEGLIRRPERPGWFAPADDPNRGVMHTRDAAIMARHAGLGTIAPFTVEQTTPNPAAGPLAGQTRIVFPNRHLEYAMTWFLLAATFLVVWAIFLGRRLRRTASAA